MPLGDYPSSAFWALWGAFPDTLRNAFTAETMEAFRHNVRVCANIQAYRTLEFIVYNGFQ